tara:strand:+ start:312 stop:659 length:348 start_codon:yes stop_codon:yes gene_type:complete
MKYTYKNLSEMSDVKINTLCTRVKRLNIKGEIDNSEVFFDANQSYRIINAHKKFKKKNSYIKIEAIDLHKARIKIKNIAKILMTSENYITDYIKEYRETKCIIVESSINLDIIEF